MSATQIDIIANITTKVNGAEAGLNKLKTQLSQLKMPENIDAGLKKSFSNLDGLFAKYKAQLKDGFKTKGDVSAFAKTGRQIEAEYDRITTAITKLTGKEVSLKIDTTAIRNAEKEIEKLVSQKEKLMQNIQSGLGLEDVFAATQTGKVGFRGSKLKDASSMLETALGRGEMDKAREKLQLFISELERLKGSTRGDLLSKALGGSSIDSIINRVKTAVEGADSSVNKFNNDIKKTSEEAAKIKSDQYDRVGNALSKVAGDAAKAQSGIKGINGEAQQTAQSMFSMVNQLDQLKSSTQYFFGLRNMINLLKRGFREALDTVKELDAAMTETAVVTKFDVGDMWEKLPEYTANANALGATVQDMYKSATLYYQQGLNAQQAMGIASETMKMARIGGLEATEATDMMTAALRGFNMELSDVSAQRINDVYSNLAAKTASNTRELGEAMERTASIANSAGMSFEGTSAFLAQMIETTREAPENLGTAMKTIIARFQELKKNPLEMEEVDGEVVSFNKVDAALQTIGVSLKDTNGQFRELDQVFLDIASKWDGLSQTQQRYIATTAAGSRQQSRFIAMMNNYDRTVQLMGFANDSAGASNEQFGKTMESMEAKLNKLKNAWDLFTMGLASNDMAKGAVDTLTKIVNGVTKLIDTLSFGSSKLKSILTIFTAFTGLRLAGKGVNALLGGLGGMLDPNSSVIKGAFGGGLLGSRQGNAAAQAKMINQPIVSVLNQILGAVRTGKTGTTNVGTRADYKQSLSNFRKSANQPGATISGTLGTLKGLDSQQVRLISKSNVGTMRQLQRSMAQSDMGKVLAAQMVTAMKRGNISGNQVAGLSKANIGKILGTQEAQAYSESFSKNVLPKMQQSIQRANENAQVQWASGMKNRFEAEAFMNEDVNKLLMKKTQDKDGNWVDNPLYNKEFAQYAKKNRKEIEEANKQQAKFGNDILKKKTSLETVQNAISHIGGAAITAGQGLMSLGATLNSMGFEAAGAAVSSFGSALSNLGMIANGLPAMLSLLSNPFGIAAAVAGAGIGLMVHEYQKNIKKIKESAEEVTNSFKETQEETTTNIANLKIWKDEMATLSKGVDKNGLNIDLSDVDYAHYLEIVDAVAKMNPEIVKGYNAQGHAIIDNNKALEETLKKQQELQKGAQEKYIEEDALQALINARNINKAYVDATTKIAGKKGTKWEEDQGFAGTTRVQATPMTTDVSNLLSNLKSQKGLDVESILKTYNIDLKELESGQQQAINQFVKFQDKINSDVSKAVGADLDDAITEGFSKLSDDTAAFDEAIQPVLQNLQTYASTLPGFNDIGQEFQSAINSGLKDIVIQPDLDASQMQNQAQLLIQEFDNLTRKGGDYATAMESVEEAQNQFASSLDASEYARNTEDALETLNSLLKQYEGNTTAYGQAISEYLQNQIDKIQKFTEEGSASITEAFNGVTSTIAGAEGAYSAFQDSTKTDFSTGAESMKSIFDEVTKETDGVMLHMEKMGDQTMWKGARALLGDEFVEKNGENVEAVKKELLSLKSELQEGEKGFAAFWDNFRKVDDSKIEGFTWNEDGSYNLDRDINPDAYKEIAEQMHRSEEYVVSMLNKGRQFADIDFTNIDDVRKALSTDNAAITGTTSTDGNTDLFVKKDYLQNAMAEAGIVNPAEQAKEIGKLLAKGVKVIPNAKDMTKEDFKSMGISDIPSLVQKLGDTGQFSRSEIEEYAQQLEGGKYNAEELDAVYKDYLDSQEHPELPSINSIDSNVSTIASILASNRVAEGYADEATIAAYEEAKSNVKGADNKHDASNPDSVSEYFANGKNAKGQDLTEAEYKLTEQAIKKEIDYYSQMEERARAGAKVANDAGRTADAEELLKEAAGYQKMAEWLTSDLELGQNIEKANAEKKAREDAEKKGTEAQVKSAQAAQEEHEAAKEAIIAQNQLTHESAEMAANQRSGNAQRDQNSRYEAQNKSYQDREQKRIDAVEKKVAKIATDPREEAIKKANEANKRLQEEQAKKDRESRRESILGEQNRAPRVEAEQAGAQKQLSKTQTLNKGQAKAQLSEILQQDMDLTLKEAIGGLNISEIAADPGKTQALSNIYKDIMEGSLPTAEDLNTLGILDQWNIDETQSKASEYINGWKDFLTSSELLESLDFDSTIDALTEADKTAYALEALGGADNVNKAITWIGQRLKTWWDKLNGLNTEADSNSSTTPSQPSNQASQATSGAAKGATSSITEAVTKFTSIGQEEVEGSIDTIQAKAEQGADLKVKAIKDNSLTIAQNAINQLKSATSSGVTLKTNTSGIDNAAKAPVSKPVNIQDNATPKIKSIDAAAKKSVTKTINISPHYTGTWQHSVYLSATGPGAKAATGVNNKISYHHVPQAGSAARGTKKGRLGPRGQGGLTLTGERGYEVAWLPSENRSTILGANGPQMVDLPKDAVIYNHEQSKDILKRKKSISAGSMDSGSYNATAPSPSKTSGSSKKSSSKSKKKSSKKSKGSSDSVINNWSIEEVVRFDIDRKLETLASKIKKATDEIDKKLGRIGTKASHISAQTQAQVKNLQAVKANNEAIVASYQRDLNKLDTGGYNAKISYETGGSGKKKKNKTTDETIDLSNYIYRDANGDYQIDKNAIANAGSKAKQEAIYKAAEGALNPLVSGLQKAKDAADDAQKQMDELGKKISETFYQWENEITEVYDLTQRISHEESLRGRFSSQVALQLSKLNAGFGTAAQSIGLMQKALERDNKVLLEQIENQQKMIGARQRELKEALSAQDELDNLNRLRNKAYASTAAKTETINWATDQYTAARLGRNYLSNVRQDMDGSLRYEIDWARFNRDQKNDPYNKETYEAIKKYLDDLSSATDEFNNAIKDQTDLIKETYDALKEYQDYVGDYEDTLLKGLEEEIQNEVDNSKKLSDSITNALKDLLDEVKRKLDERRKQEDNRKTEDDIAKKQQRLAALRADTSGGNAVEIAQLEKEIAESQQSYQRTLEDQLLDKLQQQGDEAAKQRERLIDLTEKQLEVSSSNNTALVDMWLRDPETYKEQIKNAWLEAQGYSEKGEAGQYILQQEFESGFANLVTAINQSGFANGFESISGDTSTLVGLLEMLTEGRDKLTDSLSKAAGALQDVEKRDTESFELGKRTQKTAAQWKAEGLGAGDLKKWGYTFKELKDSGFTNAELKNAGFTVKDFRDNGISGVKDLRNAGFKAADLKPFYGLTRELYNSSTWEDLKAAKFSVQDYVNIGVKDAASLRKAGITLNQLKSNATAWNSNSWAAIRKAGYTAADYKSAGLSYANAIASGFTDQQLYSYYTEAKTKIDNANKAAANKTAYNNAITAAHKAGTVTKATLKDAIAKGAAYGVGKNAYQVASDLANGDGDGGVTWKEVMAQLKALGYSGKTVKSWNPNAASGSAFRKAFVSKYGKWSKFATGGLASFTGPAWLDGTPSKPELVLNARDTKNFIMLKDVLSKAMDSSNGLSGFGSAAYEININVDHINSDYDVDKIAKRVKENIVKDSGYRNVTQVRKFR